MSNNVAEYSGVIAILRFLADIPAKWTAVIRGDSKLVIMQLSGQWRVKSGLYIPYFNVADALLDIYRPNVKLEWIPREQNDACDVLSKDVLRARGVKFRLQPEAVAGGPT